MIKLYKTCYSCKYKRGYKEVCKGCDLNYSKYELGKVLIHTYPLIDFARHYNISIDYLCGKTKDSVIK